MVIETNFFVCVIEGLVSLPILLLSSYLMLRFVKAYSRSSMKNLLRVSTLMTLENGLNVIIRAVVGVKVVFEPESSAHLFSQKFLALLNFLIPAI